jgi:hypothetical protein
MPAGGFVGESKSAILTALAKGGAPVAPFTVMSARTPAASRVCAARRFADEHGLPLVLKPDQGQRGSGVRILRSLSSLERAVAALSGDHILQAYVAGPEFGLFYARRLHEPAGRVISITTKELPTVVGDGTRTLDELILGDRRAVALLDVYRETNADRLRSVPGRGERVAIAELGTHCRGAIFRDGRFLRTPALERAVDAASRAMNGFSFGRFDVRAESESALREGRFQLLELNGVTSEPTHIYDPCESVFSAWRTLACTWTLAFAIGSDHAAAGARVWSLRELLECVLAYRRFTNNTAQPPGGATVRAAAAGAEPAA